jgi:signal transduction histidine kinase
MSYRALKRLLGETSLERKCRFLFGAGTLLLLSLSFWWYARKTEDLAYEQTPIPCRLLANQVFEREYLKRLRVLEWENAADPSKDEFFWPWEKPKHQGAKAWEQMREKLDELARQNMPRALPKYGSDIIIANPKGIPLHLEGYESDLLKEFQADKNKNEEWRRRPAKPGEDSPVIHYYGAIRASKDLLAGLPLTPQEREAYDDLQEGDLLAIVKVVIPTKSIEEGINWNRALLITMAVFTTAFAMIISYVIVRYVIVKPVKHLKEVSDAISAGQLNVRSEIQTRDEFEDLSHAFNRMLRSLVGMQDRLRKVNTDLDRKVDELAQANMALYESNRLKSDFLATMSHELRTPLNSILGFSEVLLTGNHLDDKQQRWVQNIQTSGGRLLNLINDILDLAKIEAGKMQVRPAEFSIQDVCEGLLNMFRPLAEKKNIDLRGQVDPGIPMAWQDVNKLQQILSNLLSNAIKFTPEGGRVMLKAEAEPLHVVITVTDTGVGIAPEERELVFEKFRQSGNPLTREHAGTGLGLSIVRELTKLLGGEVTLQSELGRGSTFRVRLPLRLSEENRFELDLASERPDSSAGKLVDIRFLAPDLSQCRESGANVANPLVPESPPSVKSAHPAPLFPLQNPDSGSGI